MTYNFCTLFDKNYIYRGLCLYRSIVKNCGDFKLWILCMDEEVYDVLNKLKLVNTVLVRLQDIESQEVLAAKKDRSAGEYCWTLSSVFAYHILINNPHLENLSYIDSDTYFFSDPKNIYLEMEGKSVGIIRHNYSSGLEYLEKRSGIYNVAMVIFKNDQNGLACLKWWKEQCLKWCYNRFEDGKFGDQMYLDDWPSRFAGVHVIKQKGADAAPWNINRYTLSVRGGKAYVDEDELIFYHFHSLKIFGAEKFQYHSYVYKISEKAHEIIYEPYIREVSSVVTWIKSVASSFSYGFDKKVGFAEIFKQYGKRILQNKFKLKV